MKASQEAKRRPGPARLSPEIAALSMSGSSLVVAVNALLLKRLRLPLPGTPKTATAAVPRPLAPAGTR